MKKLAFSALILLAGSSLAQTTVPGLIGQGSQYRTITTAVPFLTITPDSRGAALGDAGVATSPDVNSSYWNAAKLVFIENKAGGSLSYTPWLAKIINDMHIVYLTGYYKISHVQAVSVSMKYFDMGDVDLRDANNNDLGTHNPRDWSFDVNYSRLLSEDLSIGGTIRYINSNLIGSSTTGQDAKPGQSVAVDIGVFYTKPMVSRNSVLSLGAAMSNIGSKISYTDANSKNFIPGNFRLGAAYKVEPSPLNSFTFVLDFNKLLAPSPDSTANTNSKTLLGGVFGSFGDAQGGFSEEIHEVMMSVGVEYWYNDVFAGRIGYFNEAKDKGNRKYLTAGVGVKLNSFGFDVAYMVPINKRENALAETLRLTLHYIPKVKEVETIN
jgi:hypothetical protein